MKNCKICKEKTKNIFNINFVATPICENCASLIFIQQACWYTSKKTENNESKKIKK